MKIALLLACMLASGISAAGTLTIVPDSTSSMGREQQRQEELAKRKAAQRARIDAGLESEPVRQRPIIIRPQPPSNLNCYSYGYENRQIRCN